MKEPKGNGLGAGAALDGEGEAPRVGNRATAVERDESAKVPYVPEKGKRKAPLGDNARVLVIGAGIVLVLLLLAIAGIPHKTLPVARKSAANRPGQSVKTPDISSTPPGSVLPLLDSGRQINDEAEKDMVRPDEIARMASKQPKLPVRATLGNIPPFDNPQPWAPAPYPGATTAPSDGHRTAPSNEAAALKNEHDLLDRASLVFARAHVASGEASSLRRDRLENGPALALAPGTRLRARLEASASTADPAPVVAVIEYNYEQNGEIVVPAGSKVFGHLQTADRSGYVAVRFDSLMLPDGSETSLQASATGLDLGPLKGAVEGKHARRNLVVRSVAGVGQMAAALTGRGSLNQPLSESDLLREKLGNNIAQASDQEVAKLVVTEHLVVSLAAGTEIYVVLSKPAKWLGLPGTGQLAAPPPSGGQPDLEELRQLLQLQRELKTPANATAGADQKLEVNETGER